MIGVELYIAHGEKKTKRSAQKTTSEPTTFPVSVTVACEPGSVQGRRKSTKKQKKGDAKASANLLQAVTDQTVLTCLGPLTGQPQS